MSTCDLNNGRLKQDCRDNVAGVKTVYFFTHSLLRVEKNLAGEVDYIGKGNMYRFEQDMKHGLAIQEIIRGDLMTQYIKHQIDLTLFYITPEYITTIDYLKQNRWAIFFLDMENNIRLMGEHGPMTQAQGVVDQSGTRAGDIKWSNLSFLGDGGAYAPFLAPFTDYPFDNFPDIVIIPPYGEEDLYKYENPDDRHYGIDALGNRFKYR